MSNWLKRLGLNCWTRNGGMNLKEISHVEAKTSSPGPSVRVQAEKNWKRLEYKLKFPKIYKRIGYAEIDRYFE